MLGSKDRDALSEMLRDQPSPEVSAVLTQAVMQGAPFPGLTLERVEHVGAAAILSSFRQSHLATDSVFYTYSDLYGFRERCRDWMTPESLETLSLLCDGRPLFGSGFEDPSMLYGYLSDAEVKSILAELPEISEPDTWDSPDWDNLDIEVLDDEFARDFRGWLSELSQTGLDLWLVLG